MISNISKANQSQVGKMEEKFYQGMDKLNSLSEALQDLTSKNVKVGF